MPTISTDTVVPATPPTALPLLRGMGGPLASLSLDQEIATWREHVSALVPGDASRMVTVPTCGDGDTCATVRLERLPQGKFGGCSRGPADARLAPGRFVTILHDEGA